MSTFRRSTKAYTLVHWLCNMSSIYSSNVLHYPCSIDMRNCWLVRGVVALWRMSWKRMKTFGTNLFLYPKNLTGQLCSGRQSANTHTHIHTHTHPTLCLSWRTDNFHFHLLRRGFLRKPVERFPKILLFLADCVGSSAHFSQFNQ